MHGCNPACSHVLCGSQRCRSTRPGGRRHRTSSLCLVRASRGALPASRKSSSGSPDFRPPPHHIPRSGPVAPGPSSVQGHRRCHAHLLAAASRLKTRFRWRCLYAQKGPCGCGVECTDRVAWLQLLHDAARGYAAPVTLERLASMTSAAATMSPSSSAGARGLPRWSAARGPPSNCCSSAAAVLHRRGAPPAAPEHTAPRRRTAAAASAHHVPLLGEGTSAICQTGSAHASHQVAIDISHAGSSARPRAAQRQP